jgi:BlaI family transcriptional regulator, penicillinase repressor
MSFLQVLSRRERQIMDVLYQLGAASVANVREALPDPPSYSATRTLLGILETKGHIKHVQQGKSYVYEPVRSRQATGQSAMRQLLHVFFSGSVESAMTALLKAKPEQLTNAEFNRLQELIRQARDEGR